MPRRTDLLGQLTAFEPTGEAETAHRVRMVELLACAGDPFSRKHFIPGHFTASSFVLSPDRASLLLIFHGKFHRWLQPGGHLDPTDADTLAAARREVLEETGVADLRLAHEGVFDADIHPIPPHPDRGEPAHEHFDVRYLFAAGGLDFAAASDARDARWVKLDEVTREMTDASVMRAVGKLRTAVRCGY